MEDITGGRRKVEDRLRSGTHHRALVGCGQETRTVRGWTALDSAGGIGQDNKGGKILIFGSEAVPDPAPQTRLAHHDRTCVHLIDGLGVVDTIGVARADDGEIVNAFGDVG